MLKAYCTYCSSRKRRNAEPLPACERYLGPRIRNLHAAAWRQGALFLILSGEFGLLRAADPIPWYDHLLKPAEVPTLAERVAGQLQGLRLDELEYHTAPLDTTPAVLPSYDTIAEACRRAGVRLTVRELPADLP